jgi:lambda repressor-like predicted transcriptional regulator
MSTVTKQVFNPAPLRLARHRRGTPLFKLALAIGKSEATVCLTLNGKARNPETVRALCEVLGVDPREVWPDEPGGPTGSGPDGTPAESPRLIFAPRAVRPAKATTKADGKPVNGKAESGKPKAETKWGRVAVA